MINTLIRQLQIDIITNTPNPIIDWFNDLWSRMYVMETEVYHGSNGESIYEVIYYIINDNQKEYVFYYDMMDEDFWCNHYRYWSILDSNFNFKLNYTDIQDITKILLENALNYSIKGQIRRSIINQEVDIFLNKS